jgi:hypothetical protein
MSIYRTNGTLQNNIPPNTYVLCDVNGRTLVAQPLEKTNRSNKYMNYLPNFAWSAKKYVIPFGSVDSITLPELEEYIRKELGTSYLISPGKDSYIYLYRGLHQLSERKAVEYRTFVLDMKTLSWSKYGKSISGLYPFLDRELTDDERACVAVANLQLPED